MEGRSASSHQLEVSVWPVVLLSNPKECPFPHMSGGAAETGPGRGGEVIMEGMMSMGVLSKAV